MHLLCETDGCFRFRELHFCASFLSQLQRCNHSDYRTVSPYWVLPVYVELIRAVWADDGGQATMILTK
jgi:hypothetical protein